MLITRQIKKWVFAFTSTACSQSHERQTRRFALVSPEFFSRLNFPPACGAMPVPLVWFSAPDAKPLAVKFNLMIGRLRSVVFALPETGILTHPRFSPPLVS